MRWYLKEAKKAGGRQVSIEELSARFVILNFASIYPTVGLLQTSV